ncbi:MAG: hypothetical protein QM487_06955 [Candidatus Marithrix sp.]
MNTNVYQELLADLEQARTVLKQFQNINFNKQLLHLKVLIDKVYISLQNTNF